MVYSGMAYKNKETARLYRIAYREANKNRLKDYLETHPCVKCGEAEIIFLDFDHIDPKTKSFNIPAMTNGTAAWEAILDEIAKCQVLCVKCHRRKTLENKDYLNRTNTDGGRADPNPYLGNEELGQTHTLPTPEVRNWINYKACTICIDCGCKVAAQSIRCKPCDGRWVTSTTYQELNTPIPGVTRNCPRSKIVWPDNLTLLSKMQQSTMLKLAAELGVTDNSIRKHCQRRGIEIPIMPWNTRSKNKHKSS